MGLEEAEAKGREADSADSADFVDARVPVARHSRSAFNFTSIYALGVDDSYRFHLKRVRVKRRFVANKLLHYSEDSQVLLRSVMFFPNSGPILSKHRLLIGHIVSGQPMANQLGRRRIPAKAKFLDSAFAQYSGHGMFEVPALGQVPEADGPDASNLHPVQLMPWEDDIVWSEGDVKSSKLAPLYAEVRTEPAPSQPPTTVHRYPPRAMPIIPPGVNRSLSSISPTLSALASMAPAALSALIAQQRKMNASPQPSALLAPLIKNPATRVPNTEFMLGAWLEQIIWAEEDRPPMSYPSDLILSLNDPLLLLDTVEVESLSRKINKAEKLISKRLKKLPGVPSMAQTGHANPAAATTTSKSAMMVNYSRPIADRFNLSNDKFYELKPAVQKSSSSGGAGGVDPGKSGSLRTGLQHSIPALKLLPPHFSSFKGKADLRAWHRPKLAVQQATTVTFSAVKPKKKKSNNRVGQVIRNSKKLTLRDGGPFSIVEYSEEFPLLLQNPGMATHVILYYRKRSPKDPYVPADPHALIRLLEPTDPSPLWTFGDIPMGQSLYVLSNNLFRAPLFIHPAPPTDFLLIRNTDKSGQVRHYLRELGAAFLAGQVFPLLEVYSPHSRKHNLFCRHRLQVAAYRLFQRDQNERKRLKASRLSKAFPQFSDGSIRKWLKEYAESQRAGSESGTWLMKADAPSLGEDELRALVTPEMVCVYEAMLAGQQRLLDAGLVHESTAPSGETEADADDKSLDDEASSQQPGTQQPADSLVTPWSLSSGFLNSINNNGMVRLEGLGDPSGRGEMFSFVKGAPPSLQISKVTDDSSLADVFRKSRNNAELQSLFNQEKRRIWETQVRALSSKEIPLPPSVSLPVPSPAPSPAHSPAPSPHDESLDEPVSAEQDSRSSSICSVSQHKLVIRRSSIVNGVFVQQAEEITDPRVISVYLRQRRLFDVKRKRRANAVLAATVSKQRKKRLKEEQQALYGLQVPSHAAKKPRKEVNVRCGACGAVGHMRTNRICPMYKEEEGGGEGDGSGGGGSGGVAGMDHPYATTEPAAVRVEGTKLSINAEALHRIVEQEKSFKLKIHMGAALSSQHSSLGDHERGGGGGDGKKGKKKKKLDPSEAFVTEHPDKKDMLVELNNLLAAVTNRLMAEPDSWPFQRPVSRRDYPHYYQMIAKPIDLGSIRAAAAKHKYLHAAELLAKVQLMANNCLQFNRADHVFTNIAFRLLDQARELCASEQITSLEQRLHAETASRVAIEDGEVDVLQDD